MSHEHGGLPMNRNAQGGNVLFMILIACALLGALGAVMMRDGGQNATTMSADKISETLTSQVQTIRSALMECNLTYNFGYPTIASDEVNDLQCQIDDVPSYKDIFKNNANYTSMQGPTGFGNWQYTNDGAGTITITIISDHPGDAAVRAALDRMSRVFDTGNGEADIVNDGNTAGLTVYIQKP